MIAKYRCMGLGDFAGPCCLLGLVVVLALSGVTGSATLVDELHPVHVLEAFTSSGADRECFVQVEARAKFGARWVSALEPTFVRELGWAKGAFLIGGGDVEFKTWGGRWESVQYTCRFNMKTKTLEAVDVY